MVAEGTVKSGHQRDRRLLRVVVLVAAALVFLLQAVVVGLLVNWASGDDDPPTVLAWLKDHPWVGLVILAPLAGAAGYVVQCMLDPGTVTSPPDSASTARAILERVTVVANAQKATLARSAAAAAAGSW